MYARCAIAPTGSTSQSLGCCHHPASTADQAAHRGSCTSTFQQDQQHISSPGAPLVFVRRISWAQIDLTYNDLLRTGGMSSQRTRLQLLAGTPLVGTKCSYPDPGYLGIDQGRTAHTGPPRHASECLWCRGRSTPALREAHSCLAHTSCTLHHRSELISPSRTAYSSAILVHGIRRPHTLSSCPYLDSCAPGHLGTACRPSNCMPR